MDSVSAERNTYIIERRQLGEADVFGSTNERLMDGGEEVIFEVCRAFASVDESAVLTETGLAAAVEVLVGFAYLAEIVCSFGSLRVG